MGRYVIQSGVTFAFLHSDPRTGDVSWTPSLLAALHFGVVEDLDRGLGRRTFDDRHGSSSFQPAAG